MDSNLQNRLLIFLSTTYDYDGTIHFLALSATELSCGAENIRLRLRVALTLKEGDSICPYFDGTEMSVEVGLKDIRFTDEEEWADGPPIMEGSPNKLALPWVSELAPPFYVSSEALAATKI